MNDPNFYNNLFSLISQDIRLNRPSLHIPPPRQTKEGKCVTDVATSSLDLPSNTLPQLPKPPPRKAWKRAQEERAKYAKQRGKAMIKNTIAEIAARDAEIRKAAKAGGTNSDANNNGKV